MNQKNFIIVFEFHNSTNLNNYLILIKITFYWTLILTNKISFKYSWQLFTCSTSYYYLVARNVKVAMLAIQLKQFLIWSFLSKITHGIFNRFDKPIYCSSKLTALFLFRLLIAETVRSMICFSYDLNLVYWTVTYLLLYWNILFHIFFNQIQIVLSNT